MMPHAVGPHRGVSRPVVKRLEKPHAAVAPAICSLQDLKEIRVEGPHARGSNARLQRRDPRCRVPAHHLAAT
jgi:hypothetical protein